MSTDNGRRPGQRAIVDAFAAARGEGRCALITYLTVGYPTPQDTVALCLALQEGGADIIELGVPFSDPIADGPAIQRASQAALQAGMTPPGCLRLAGEMRGRGVTVPLIFMGYYNPIHSYGIDAYVQDCAQVGIDGLIVPDLPLEEAEPLQAACRAAGLALIFLVAPTSNTQRIAQIAAATQGFLYVVSRLGTTGVGAGPDADIGEQMRLIRQHATTPVAVGFGISQPDQARALAHLADGVIVGSAIVSHAAHGSDGLRQFVASLRNALHTDLRGL